MPSFLNNADAIKAKGVDTIAVTGVNDVFVMDAWKKATGADGKIEFLADGNGEFAKAIDLTFDGSGNGLGTRSKRYSMLVEDGVVKKLNIEDAPGKCDISGGAGAARRRSSLTSSSSRLCAPARAAINPSRASSSARSFMAWPAWPFTQCQWTVWCCERGIEPLPQIDVLHRLLVGGAPAVASSSCGSSSMMPSRRYWLSVCRSTVHGRLSASSAEIAAINSMRLLVVCGLAALQFLLVVAERQDRAPAARPGIARAGAVGVDGDALLRSSIDAVVAARS